jgi:hypothetical protein
LLRLYYNESRNILRNKLQIHIQQGGKLALTQDIWTGTNQKSYIGVLVHWIDSDWSIQSRCLGLINLHSKHDGIYLANILKHILAKFQLTQDNICT